MSAVNYVDGIGRVTVVNGLAHIDLITVVPPAKDGEQPLPQVTQRLVMALPQFVRTCAEMAGHLQRMEQQGLIKRNQAPPATGG